MENKVRPAHLPIIDDLSDFKMPPADFWVTQPLLMGHFNCAGVYIWYDEQGKPVRQEQTPNTL